MIIKLFRKYTKIFLWGIAVVIIPTFILWGVGTGIQNRQRASEAGKIFGKRVTWDAFDQAYRSVQILLSLSNLQVYAQNLNPIDLTWDRLILLHEAKKRGVTVSNDEIVEYVRNMPVFWKPENPGQFDRERYETILQSAFRMDPRTFEEDVRKTLVISKLREEIGKEFSMDEETLREEYEKLHEQRRVSYLSWKSSDFEKDVPVTEEALKAYYDTHAAIFNRGEGRRAAYVMTDFATDSEASKIEIRNRMDRVFDATLEGKTLEEAAKQEGLVARETDFFSLGDPLPVAGFSYDWMQKLFQLNAGETTEPIETGGKIVIMKVLEIHPPQTLSFEEAHKEVEKRYRTDQAMALARKKAEEAKAALQEKLSAMPWEEAVQAVGLNLNQTDFFGRQGFIETIGFAPTFSEAAFHFPLKEVSGVIPIPDGFVILRVEEEKPVTEEAFQEEKETFRERILAERQADHFIEWYRTLREKAALVSNVELPEPEPSESP